MIGFLSFIFALGLGFGISCWIYGTLLNKSNNLGDSKGDRREYGISVLFTARKDRLSSSERNSFCATYARRIDDQETNPSGTEQVRRLTDEEIESYKNAVAQEQSPERANVTDLGVTDPDYEFRQWEQNMNASQAPSAFKPYDPDN